MLENRKGNQAKRSSLAVAQCDRVIPLDWTPTAERFVTAPRYTGISLHSPASALLTQVSVPAFQHRQRELLFLCFVEGGRHSEGQQHLPHNSASRNGFLDKLWKFRQITNWTEAGLILTSRISLHEAAP